MSEPLVWVDIETTGLDPSTDSILEVGLIITDGDLQVTHATGRIVAPTRKLLARADDFVQQMHLRSGLAAELADGWGVAKVQAERELVEWLEQAGINKNRSPMCGSSVSFDRSFLVDQMPDLAAMFHYRQIDVSSLKELVRRWYPDDPEPPMAMGAHRAIPDLHDSIDLLRYYRKTYFLPGGAA